MKQQVHTFLRVSSLSGSFPGLSGVSGGFYQLGIPVICPWLVMPLASPHNVRYMGLLMVVVQASKRVLVQACGVGHLMRAVSHCLKDRRVGYTLAEPFPLWQQQNTLS